MILNILCYILDITILDMILYNKSNDTRYTLLQLQKNINFVF